MKIVLSGVETINKGAELMLYAILQEIERKYPDAIVYVPYLAAHKGLEYIQTPLNLKNKPYRTLVCTLDKFYVLRILRKLKLRFLFFTEAHIVSNADYFIDASGFHFSDQFNYDDFQVRYWEKILTGYSKQGTKIIFLPQAYGPIKLKTTHSILQLLNNYANIIIPRDRVSYNYLIEAGVDISKILLFPDFTSLVKGTVPLKYSHLQNAVCIIPNVRMIDRGIIKREMYIDSILTIVSEIHKKGYTPYLLNHEGAWDEKLAYECTKRLSTPIEVVSRLNALDIKGLISTSYLVISSRFHGIVSSLNSSVPCLSTSWSHKYEELYRDYKLDNCLLNLNDMDGVISSLDLFLDCNYNNQVRAHLKPIVSQMNDKTRRMWDIIWKL
jgi:colanic acid/amylovoran biosynthesis protein